MQFLFRQCLQTHFCQQLRKGQLDAGLFLGEVERAWQGG